MRRKRWLSDYDRRTGADGKDTYVYTGPEFTLEVAKRGRMVAFCWLAPLVGFAIFIGLGLQNTAGMRQFYIALPYASLFMPLGLLVGDAFKFTAAKAALRRADYERCVVQMKRCTLAVVALSAVIAAGQAASMLFGGYALSAGDWVYFLGAVLMSGFFTIFLLIQKQIRVTERR